MWMSEGRFGCVNDENFRCISDVQGRPIADDIANSCPKRLVAA